MSAYASIEDLEARWRPLTTDEGPTAEVLLDDAAVQILTEVPTITTRIEAGDVTLLAAVVRVECAMVKRAMTANDGGYGVTSAQETQGPFSRTFQYSNPMGDLYLTKAEKRLLGASGQKAFAVDMGPTETPYILDYLADVRLASPQARLVGFE